MAGFLGPIILKALGVSALEEGNDQDPELWGSAGGGVCNGTAPGQGRGVYTATNQPPTPTTNITPP